MKKRKINKNTKIAITFVAIVLGLLFYNPLYIHFKSRNILDKIYYSVDKQNYLVDSKIDPPGKFNWLNPRDRDYSISNFKYLEESLEKNERLEYKIRYNKKSINIVYFKRLEDNLFLNIEFYYYVDDKFPLLTRNVTLYYYKKEGYYMLNKADTYKYFVKHNITYSSLDKKSIEIAYDTIFRDWITKNFTGYSHGNYGYIIVGDINISTID